MESFTKADLPLLNALQPADWPDVKPVFYWYLNSNYCYPIKLIVGNKLVAVGAAILHGNVAWLGHIIVHPEYRNCGYGKMITENLMLFVQKKGIHSIYLIATDLGYSVYRKIGFTTETEYLFYQDIKGDVSVPLSHNILPYSHHYLSKILALDKKVSGEVRVDLVTENLKNGFIYLQKNEVIGYYLPALREGSIIAKTYQSGTDLMHLRLRTKVNASFPVDNKAAIQFMENLQYSPFKTAKRMYCGKPLQWQCKNIYNRISGNLG